LDLALWLEEGRFGPENRKEFGRRCPSGKPLDVYGLNTTEGRFHNEQFQFRDAATVLSMTRQFQADEQVELEVYYNSGSGNREIKPIINDIPLDLRMRDIDNYYCNG